MKTCSKCREVKALEGFHRSAKAKDGRASWCRECANKIERVRQRRDYHPDQKRRWQLKTRYRMTPEQVAKMRSAQGGRCGVCRLELRKEYIDHDHATGKVRGIVCHRCNVLLGGWDDRTWRESAAAWLGFSIVANEEAQSECA